MRRLLASVAVFVLLSALLFPRTAAALVTDDCTQTGEYRGTLRVQNGDSYTKTGTWYCDLLDVQAGGTLFAGTASNNGGTGTLTIRASTITIAGTVNGNGRGYTNVAGTGSNPFYGGGGAANAGTPGAGQAATLGNYGVGLNPGNPGTGNAAGAGGSGGNGNAWQIFVGCTGLYQAGSGGGAGGSGSGAGGVRGGYLASASNGDSSVDETAAVGSSGGSGGSGATGGGGGGGGQGRINGSIFFNGGAGGNGGTGGNGGASGNGGAAIILDGKIVNISGTVQSTGLTGSAGSAGGTGSVGSDSAFNTLGGAGGGSGAGGSAGSPDSCNAANSGGGGGGGGGGGAGSAGGGGAGGGIVIKGSLVASGSYDNRGFGSGGAAATTVNGGTVKIFACPGQAPGGVANTGRYYSSVVPPTGTLNPPKVSTGPVSIDQINWSWFGQSIHCPTGTATFADENGTPILPLAYPETTSYLETYFDATGNPQNLPHTRRVTISSSYNGTSPMSAGITGYTLANPPIGASHSQKNLTTTQLQWSGNSNPSYTRYEITMIPDNLGSGTTKPYTVDANWTASAAQVPVAPGITYKYYIRAYNGRASDGSGDTLTSPFIGTFATAPTLRGLPLTSDSIQWSWPAAVFSLDANPQYDVINPITGAVTASAVHPVVTTPESFGGPPNTMYARNLRTLDDSGSVISFLSNGASAYTMANPPLSVSSASVFTSSAVINWNQNSNPGHTRYEIALSPDNFLSAISTPVATADNMTSASAQLTGLSPGTTYYFRVRAINGRASDNFGVGFTSSSPNITENFVTRPARPTLAGTPLNPTNIRWDWSLVAGATGYRLYDAIGGGLLIDTPGLSYTSSTLVGGNPYTVEIEAYNSGGLASFPRTRTVAWTQPAQPLNLTVTYTSTGSAKLIFNPNGNPPSASYLVATAVDGAFTRLMADTIITGSTAVVKNLLPGTTYYFKAKGLGGILENAFSNTASTRTASSTNVLLSSAPLSPYSLLPGAMGLWHFEQTGSTGGALVAYDSSGFYSTATLSCLSAACASTPTFSAGPPNLSTAAAFAGLTHGAVTIPDINPGSPPYDFSGSLTLSAWVKPANATAPNGTGLIAKGDGGSESFGLDIFGNKYRFLFQNTALALQTVTATSTIRAGLWDHVLGTYDAAGAMMKIYLNGVLSASAGVAGARHTNTHRISLGNRQSASGSYDLPFNGAIDAVGIFDRVFVASEAYAQYQGAFPAQVVPPFASAPVKVTLPPNAFGGEAVVAISTNPVDNPIRQEFSFVSESLIHLPTAQVMVPGAFYEIVATVAGAPFTQTLGSPATVTMSYPDAANTGTVDGTFPKLNASSLAVSTFDPASLRWVQLPSTVDRAAKTVTAATPHFSLFALFGVSSIGTSLQQIRVFPRPWKIGSGGRQDAAQLTFDNLPTQGRLRLFTLTGDQVDTIEFGPAANGTVRWDGNNSHGARCASGIYFAFIESSANKVSSVVKFAIER